MSDYRTTLKTIAIMNEKDLLEFFHDLENVDIVQRIGDCAYQFVDNYEEPENISESEEKDWKRQDDAQRYADIKSTQDSFR